MMRQLAGGAAALGTVAVLALVGPQLARAQYSYPSGYDPQSGQRWERDFRYDPVLNPFGFREPEYSRLFFAGRVVYPAGYSYAAAPMNYYRAPVYGFMPPADYTYGASSAPAPDNAARIRLIVPAGAKVWFGNTATQQTGRVRFFDSPQLTPGKDYAYDVKATWTENGKEVSRTRQVDVRANSSTTVDLTRQ